jgi:ABC-type transport system involved in multi-copper enzyme maturation permease subunit
MHQSAAPAAPRKRRRRARRSWSAWLVCGIVAATAAGLTVAQRLAAPGPVLLAVAAAGLAGAAWVLRQQGQALAGPLFFYDLLRLARRGRSTLLRGAYALLLFGGLYLVYQHHFPHEPLLTRPFESATLLPLADLARFAGGFAVAILALQGIAVVVLTPAYLAGAIAEERDRRTLDLLFTTHLTDREIVLGKLFSRLTHLAGILLAGLPILCLLQLWGGADFSVLLAGFAVTGLSLLSVGSISILCSVVCRNSVAAVLSSYALVLIISVGCLPVPGCFVSSPLAFLLIVERQLGVDLLHLATIGPGFERLSPVPAGTGVSVLQMSAMVFGYAVVHGAIALVCLKTAIDNLRGQHRFDPGVRHGIRVTGGWDGEPLPVRPAAGQPRRRPCPTRTGGWDPVPPPRWAQPKAPERVRYPVSDPPLLWKEVYHGAGRTASWPFWAVYGTAVGAGLALFLLALGLASPWIWPPEQPLAPAAAYPFVRDGINPVVRALGILLAAAWCLGVAWRAAGSISREREARTLVGLLTLPTDREAVVSAKWLGGILRYRWLGYALAGVWTVGLLSGALHPAAVPLLALATVVPVAFLASLGVWLSLVSRNSLWANLGMALVLLLMFLGPWVALMYSSLLGGGGGGESWWDNFGQIGLNPPRAWWFLGFSWDDFRTDVLEGEGPLRGPLGATMAGLGWYAAGAGVLWLAACRRFRREQAGAG